MPDTVIPISSVFVPDKTVPAAPKFQCPVPVKAWTAVPPLSIVIEVAVCQKISTIDADTGVASFVALSSANVISPSVVSICNTLLPCEFVIVFAIVYPKLKAFLYQNNS